ncbi:SSI family serine proteinase inhibitor [Streptomyces sp. NPDC048483]|uniref:SSI family serine proteinase inhibitor n=1 Tax=Streptomyces sp. NPDC048483 TaxID=3154927 RepID=UPI00344A17BC
MSQARRVPRAAALTAVVLCTLAAGPAGSAGAAEPLSDRVVFLTVSGAGDTWIRGVQLNCPDTRGSHPHGAAACETLAEVDGDLDALPGDPRPCTKQYDPVTVTATGEWHGRPVAWRKAFPNACVLDSDTGPVFRF